METLKKIIQAMKNTLNTWHFKALIICLILYKFFPYQAFKHSRFGIFIDCTDTVVHNNKPKDMYTVEFLNEKQIRKY